MDAGGNGNGTDERDQKIKLEMLPLETREETPANEGMGGGIAQGGGPGDSIVDERDLVWPKLQVLKEEYLEDMRDLSNFLSHKSTQVMPPEQLSKLHHYNEVLGRMLPYLSVPKERLPVEFNLEKVETFSMQIVSIMETFRRKKPAQE